MVISQDQDFTTKLRARFRAYLRIYLRVYLRSNQHTGYVLATSAVVLEKQRPKTSMSFYILA